MICFCATLPYCAEHAIISLFFVKDALGIMDMSKYIGEATAYDKKLMGNVAKLGMA